MLTPNARFQLAETLWTLGAGHSEAVRELAKAARAKAADEGQGDIEAAAFNGGLSVSIHLLVGYGFELLLKAAYIHGGGDREALSKDIGHDLIAALDRAEGTGLVLRTPGLRDLLMSLRGAHLEHEFRYGSRGEVFIPPLSSTEPALGALALEVGALIFGWTRPKNT